MRTGPPHVLAMNDRREILDLLRDLLVEEGYRVTTAGGVLQRDDVLRLAPDAILLDVQPFDGGDDGWRFLALVRHDPALCRIPVLVCTAAVDVVRRATVDLAALDVRVVLKPFDIDHLLGELAACLGRPACCVPDALVRLPWVSARPRPDAWGWADAYIANPISPAHVD